MPSPLRRFHDLGEHALHVLGMHKKDKRPVRPDPRLAQHAFALAFEPGLGGVDIGHFVAHVVLAPGGVLVEERLDRGVARQRLDQLDLRAAERAIRAGRIDEADFDPLLGQVERLMNLRRPHDIAIERDAVGDRGRGDADMVETAEFHPIFLKYCRKRTMKLLSGYMASATARGTRCIAL